jgi:lincomycin biosynthesis protein lmbN
MIKVQSYADVLEETLASIPYGCLDRAVELLQGIRGSQTTVYCAGNGGSAATASHFATDLAKYCSSDPAQAIRAESLVDNPSLVTALTNDVGWQDIYSFQLQRKLRRDDVLVLFSVHGGSGAQEAGPWSQNLLGAAEIARKIGATVISFTGFDGGELSALADISILVRSWSTPLVEGWHSLAAHLIVEGLVSND